MVKAQNDDGTFDYTLKVDPDPNFMIDRGTAQITVKDGAKLNYEAQDTYMVTVVVADSDLKTAETPVTIMVTNVNEEPEIMEGGVSVSGMTSVMYYENGTGDVATYMASADGATLRLSGTDAADFRFNNGMLTFRQSPNYESPADSNRDNVYMVTVTASYMQWTDSKGRDGHRQRRGRYGQRHGHAHHGPRRRKADRELDGPGQAPDRSHVGLVDQRHDGR